MPINFKSANILNYDNWNTSGLPSGFNAISGGGESVIVTATDPFGGTSVVWETRPDGGGGADGGWNTDSYSIDSAKLYRYSVWVKRTSTTGGGTFYLGTSDDVISVSDNVTRGNPYWECSSTGGLTQNQWYLVVGHTFPYNYNLTTNHPDTGYFTISGGKIGSVNFCNIGSDLKWIQGRTTSLHRTYHYYCADNTTRLQFFRPRVDLCDGTEIKISELLANTEKVLGSVTISTEGASAKNQKVVASGGDAITTYGEWRIHRFNGAGTFTLTSFVGGDTTLPVEYLLVGGGGGGGTNMGGGGGGGGVLTGSTILAVGTYSIGVGGGGGGAPAGTGAHPSTVGSNGGNSTFNGLTAYGGGYGGLSPNSMGYQTGNAGGCGGGASGYNNTGSSASGGAGTAGQGYRGGNQGGAYYSGGGGGAGAVGTDGNNPAKGGIGQYSNILGRPFYWGGGGGGAGYSIAGADGGAGGGGGGAGGFPAGNGGRSGVTWGVVGLGTCTSCENNKPGGNGGSYSGGGGGGGSHYNYTNAGGNGGGGCVIIRYKYK